MVSSLSKEQLDAFVESVLESDANLSYVPDALERKVYTNAAMISATVLEKIVKSAKIQVMGHEITFDIHPIPQTESESTQPAEGK